MGIERPAMLKYGIKDIRLFSETMSFSETVYGSRLVVGYKF